MSLERQITRAAAKEPSGHRRRQLRRSSSIVAIACALLALVSSVRSSSRSGASHAFLIPRRPATVALPAARNLRSAVVLRATTTLPTVDSSAEEREQACGNDDVCVARLRLAGTSNLYALTSEAELQNVLAELVAKDSGRERILVVDYYAPWCRACQKLLRQMQKIAREDQFRDVAFASVDFERSRPWCNAKGMDKLPTVEIYRDGEMKQTWAGASRKRLLERLQDEMASVKAESEKEETGEDKEPSEEALTWQASSVSIPKDTIEDGPTTVEVNSYEMSSR